MNTPARVTGFVAGLAAVFGIALVGGNVVGPVGEPVAARHEAGPHADEGAQSATPAAHTADLPGGLMVSQNGYTLRLTEPTARAGVDVPVSFVIDGPDGVPVTGYEVVHEKQLHLIAVRRDLTGFQHVHPTMSAEGEWSAPLDLTAGDWRLYADFKAEGAEALTLGTDLLVGGAYRPVASRPPSRTAHVDGYTVTLDGAAVPGADSQLTLSVSKHGKPVKDLQPYLGAFGHLVALREGDLAYLHVHAAEEPGERTRSGPDVVFSTSVPSPGSYRLFLDFKHEGVVRTASFALTTSGHPQPAQQSAQQPSGHGHDDAHDDAH